MLYTSCALVAGVQTCALPILPCLSHSIHTQCPTQTQMNQAFHPSQLGQIPQQLPTHTTSQNKPTRCMGKQFPLPVRGHYNRFGWSPPNPASIECSTLPACLCRSSYIGIASCRDRVCLSV